jgi:hypothetical protein
MTMFDSDYNLNALNYLKSRNEFVFWKIMIIHVVMDFSRLKIGSTLWNALHSSNNFIYLFIHF